MNTGETFYMDLLKFARPMEGKLVDITLGEGEVVHARVLSMDERTVELAVVPKTTKE